MAVGPRAVVAIGASAGGVRALTELFALLPADLPAAVLVVLHLPPAGRTRLPEILERAGRLPAVAAREGAALEEGRVLVAPPDRHLLVHDGRVRLTRGPKENGHRPAADATLRSVAEAYGPRAIGVVLSGTRFDGAAGLGALVAAGGRALVQHPEDSLFDGMPRSALRHVTVDAVLPVAGLGRRVAELCAAVGHDRADHSVAGDAPLDDEQARLVEKAEARQRVLLDLMGRAG